MTFEKRVQEMANCMRAPISSGMGPRHWSIRIETPDRVYEDRATPTSYLMRDRKPKWLAAQDAAMRLQQIAGRGWTPVEMKPFESPDERIAWLNEAAGDNWATMWFDRNMRTEEAFYVLTLPDVAMRFKLSFPLKG